MYIHGATFVFCAVGWNSSSVNMPASSMTALPRRVYNIYCLLYILWPVYVCIYIYI